MNENNAGQEGRIVYPNSSTLGGLARGTGSHRGSVGSQRGFVQTAES